MTQPRMHQFASGAKSTEIKPRYDLIPLEALLAMANRFAYGAARHGEHNWRKGATDPDFRRDRGNHAVEHIFNYLNNRTTYDATTGEATTPEHHLEAAITNLAMLCGLEQMALTAASYEREPEDTDAADPLDIRKP